MHRQAFGCPRCSSGTHIPTDDELRAVNRTVRSMAPRASLANHLELWN